MNALWANNCWRWGGEITIKTSSANSLPVNDAAKLPAESFSIVGIDFTRIDKCDDRTVESFKHLKNLQSLWLSGTRVTDRGLEHLTQMYSLTDIDVSHTDISDRGVETLTSLSRLQGLNLAGTNVTYHTLAHMKAFPELRIISIGNSVIDGYDYEELPVLPNLVQVQHYGLQKTDVALAVLNKFPITSLNITAGDFQDRDVPLLQDLPRLSRLFIANTDISDAGLAKICKTCPSLAYFSLRGTSISDAGLEPLQTMQDLQFLDVGETAVTATGVAQLRAALPDCEIVD